MYEITYSQLSALIKNIESNSESNLEVLNGISFKFKPTINECQRVLLGFAFFGKDLSEGLLEFRSNRYFLDSIGVNIFPTKEDLTNEIKLISNKNITGDNDLSMVLDEIKRSLNKIYKSFKNNNLPNIYKNIDLPEITEIELKYLDENGYLIIPNAIPHDLCDELNSRVEYLSKWEAKSNKGGYFYGSGKMQRIYHLLAKDSIFRDLVLHPLAHQVMSHLFYRNTHHDKYYLASFHANIIEPKGEAQIWHIDSNVPEPIPPWIIRANSNFIIQDYTFENGATQIVPKSHLWLKKPNREQAEMIKGSEIVSLEAPKGALVFWLGTLWHRSGVNSTNQNRLALLATYAASHLREMCMEENPYLSMSSNTISELRDNLKELIGWNHGSKNY